MKLVKRKVKVIVRRRAAGAGIVGSVAVMAFIVIAMITGIAMLIGTGLACYYQGKISFLADQVAWREAARHQWYGMLTNKDSQADALAVTATQN